MTKTKVPWTILGNRVSRNYSEITRERMPLHIPEAPVGGGLHILFFNGNSHAFTVVPSRREFGPSFEVDMRHGLNSLKGVI